MSAFNINGETLRNVYAIDGDGLKLAYDLSGAEVYRVGKIPGYSIENIPEYYRARTLEVASQVDNLSDEWQSFVFVTDPHYPTNKMSSQPISLYLLSNCPNVSMVVLGGDYCEGNWVKARFNTWTSDFRTSNNQHYIHCLVGNHERFGTVAGGKPSITESLPTIYNTFLVDKLDEINGSPENDYYYFDVPGRKTRFVLLNTSDDGTVTISASQLAWVRQVVQLPDASWSLVVLAHVNMMVGTGLLTNKAELISAIQTCNGSIVGYICGHQHLDAVTKISDGFYELTFLCDRYAVDEHTVPREEGTITENAVTVVSFNTTTKQVVARRIGAGNNNTMSYSYA